MPSLVQHALELFSSRSRYYAPFTAADTDAKRVQDTARFMNYLNEYFDIYLLKNPDEETKLQRAIYLVTDDKLVHDLIKNK